MRTRDGHEIDWRYSDAAHTTLTKAEVLALSKGDAATRALAHTQITTGQFFVLYRGSIANEATGRLYRRVGRRLKEHNVAGLAADIGIRKLEAILCLKDRKAVVRALLQASALL